MTPEPRFKPLVEKIHEILCNLFPVLLNRRPKISELRKF